MIAIDSLVDILNDALNELIEGITFRIMPDGDDYVPPEREGNDVTQYINGIAQITDSALVPINNLTIITQTLTVNVLVPIDTEKPAQKSFEPVRSVIGEYLSKPQKYEISNKYGDYSVTFYGSQPEAGDIAMRDGVGKSIPYSFNVFFSFIEKGINSLDFEMEFDGEPVPFIEIAVIETPVTDGGAFSGTQGSAKNYATTYALEVQITVPALMDSNLTQEFAKYLLTKERKIYPVKMSYGGVSGVRNMMFTTSNITVRGTENIGQSISLIEALEDDNGGETV